MDQYGFLVYKVFSSNGCKDGPGQRQHENQVINTDIRAVVEDLEDLKEVQDIKWKLRQEDAKKWSKQALHMLTVLNV